MLCLHVVSVAAVIQRTDGKDRALYGWQTATATQMATNEHAHDRKQKPKLLSTIRRASHNLPEILSVVLLKK